MTTTCELCGNWPCICGPYVCPGCYAVGGEPCAPYCIDAAIERDMEEEYLRGEWGSIDDEDEDEPSLRPYCARSVG